MAEHTCRRPRLWHHPAVLVVLTLCLGCSGHRIRHAPNHGNQAFDFEVPNCSPASRPVEPVPVDRSVDLRYLGAGGLYVRWGEDSILLGPYFSNPNLYSVLLGSWRNDEGAIERGLAGLPLARVEAIFAGHSHYDHIGDFPAVLERAPRAHVYVNRAGAHALAPYAATRTTAFEDRPNHWVWLNGPGGEKRPIRFYAVPSVHAPQIDHYLWAKGPVQGDVDFSKPWTSHRFRDLKAGNSFALVIDLLASDNETVRFRFYYQDSANPKGIGEPGDLPGAPHPFDLAVLCMASYDRASKDKGDQPGAILDALKPHHVLAVHYENFLRQQDRPVRFVGLLTEAKVETYLKTVCDHFGCEAPSGTGPTNPVCGPSGPRWTMPLPGEWMRFAVP
jgi:L-ascorbate metabolism protein UlaG (beta-lactamase superfamily)